MTRVLSLVTLILALLAVPLAAKAQPGGKGYRIGLLETGALRPRPWAAFKERMRELGYVEGQTAASSRDGRTASSTGCPA